MKTRMVKSLWAIVLTLSPIIANAQHELRGTVVNDKGESLTGVKVLLHNTYFGTYTDHEGKYLINNVPSNTYVIELSLIGYQTLEQEITVLEGQSKFDFRLQPSVLSIEEVQVTAVRAGSLTPTTYTNLNKASITTMNYGQDLPYLLEGTPSTVVTSDAGAGVGYTGVRIRGVDPTRTNVTVNGIPLNDAESHGVWWVNMPDFASSTDQMQIQRGVGTSSNGAAAFGASINIKTDNISRDPYAAIDNSAGSFNTLKNTVKAGTGLINERFSVDARLSRISSDGFIDRANSNLKSFYLSGAYIMKNSMLKVDIFSGKEKTYQAWWGIPQSKYKGDEQGLLTHFYNNYYPGGIYETASDSSNLFNSGSNTYNYYWYDNETDNYQQDHYQLHYSKTFSNKLAFNISGHYTRGRGYYEQYKRNQDFSTYGFDPVVLGTDTIQNTDLIRRRWLDNHFYGAVYAIAYRNNKNMIITLGGGANQYLGNHFGEVIWARTASQSEIGQRYYENDANKYEINNYLKFNYTYKKLAVYADLQVRNIGYSYLGLDQSFGILITLEQSLNFTFFNPKAGLMYTLSNRSQFYGSYSVAHREPVRDDFIQSTPSSRPTPEQLGNTELGFKYRARKTFANVTLYHMNYKDQLILTGEINDVGAYNRTNVEQSYRAGIELEGGYMISKKLSVSANLTFSQNKIKEFTEFIDNYDNYDSNGNMIQDQVVHSNTDIAFSPNLISSVGLLYEPLKGLEITWLAKYVGSQYLDNTSSKDRTLDPYFINNAGISYSFKNWGFKDIKIGLMANNLFNYRYANNGYTWGYILGGTRVIENFVYPQAGRSFLIKLSLQL